MNTRARRLRGLSTGARHLAWMTDLAPRDAKAIAAVIRRLGPDVHAECAPTIPTTQWRDTGNPSGDQYLVYRQQRGGACAIVCSDGTEESEEAMAILRPVFFFTKRKRRALARVLDKLRRTDFVALRAAFVLGGPAAVLRLLGMSMWPPAWSRGFSIWDASNAWRMWGVASARTGRTSCAKPNLANVQPPQMPLSLLMPASAMMLPAGRPAPTQGPIQGAPVTLRIARRKP